MRQSEELGEAHSDYTRYARDPVGFVREVLGVRPWAKQVEILEGEATGCPNGFQS